MRFTGLCFAVLCFVTVSGQQKVDFEELNKSHFQGWKYDSSAALLVGNFFAGTAFLIDPVCKSKCSFGFVVEFHHENG